MTMVAWRSYHKHLSTQVIGIAFLHQGCQMLYSQTYSEYWSVSESLKTNMIEPAVHDVLPKFIALLTKTYTANQ